MDKTPLPVSASDKSGPEFLVPWELSLDKMKDRVARISRIQLELMKVIATEDGAARAEGFKAYVRSDVLDAQRLALSELGKSGPKALTTLREMLADVRRRCSKAISGSVEKKPLNYYSE